MIYQSILETIGNTPVIELQNIGKEINDRVSIFIKMETLNPGGNHKVRVAYNMIKDYEKQGILIPNTGQTILEATGGNTGLGIAIAGAALGYRVVLVIPDNYSLQKQNRLKAYGAEIRLSHSKKGTNSNGDLALELQLEHPDYVMLNQMQNPANPEIHRITTAQEILKDFSNRTIDYFIAGIGTGGHITGIGEVLKREHTRISIVGVQPDGCELLKERFIPHKIQGISVGMLPPILNTKVIDRMLSVTFEESLEMSKKLMKEEGLSIGISSGANLVSALKIAKEQKKSCSLNRKLNILMLAYDSADDYLDN